MSEAAPTPMTRDQAQGAAAASRPPPRLLGRFAALAKNPRVGLWAVFVVVPILASLHKWWLGPLKINNYMIFRRSFVSLWRGENLYALHPDAHFDVFKYSPTFALAMAPFEAMPVWLGLVLWNLLNTVCLGWALARILPAARRPFVFAFLFFELLTTTQNTQSNAIMAALTIFAFLWLEQGRPRRAALAVALSGMIKVYGFAAAGLLLLYPRRARSLAWTALFTVALAAAPLVVVPPEQLVWQYRNWGELLAGDHAASIGISVMGILRSWFSIAPDKLVVAAVGLVLQGAAFLRFSRYADRAWRQRLLYSLLVFLVIFNHKAESATFIIAVVAIACWYVSKQPRGWLDRALMLLAFVLTVLSPTDLFPASLRRTLVVPYALKALPCVLIWLRMQWELHAPAGSEASGALGGSAGGVGVGDAALTTPDDAPPREVAAGGAAALR